jgi:hypothetical protein
MNAMPTAFGTFSSTLGKITFSEALRVTLIRRGNAVNENSHKFLAYNYKSSLWI